MDPSALIFVALAVAWAAYLIPKALEHHEESARSRSIDRFSRGLRILARREPSSRRTSALVTVADRPAPAPAPEPVLTPAERRVLLHAHRRAATLAARRRRRMLDLLLVAEVAIVAVAILGRVEWVWTAVPAGLALLWLPVCRLAVRRERRRRAALLAAPAADAAAGPSAPVVDETGTLVAVPATDELPEPTGTAAAGGWDLLPVVVPTYVVKERVRRSVRTIDLDSTGVWSSGRSDIDSALVRDAATARDDEPGERAAPAG